MSATDIFRSQLNLFQNSKQIKKGQYARESELVHLRVYTFHVEDLSYLLCIDMWIIYGIYMVVQQINKMLLF